MDSNVPVLSAPETYLVAEPPGKLHLQAVEVPKGSISVIAPGNARHLIAQMVCLVLCQPLYLMERQ